MAYRQTIRKRDRYVDSLTVSEVAIFVGISAKTLRRKREQIPYGVVDDNGVWIFSVIDACQVFEIINKRMPRASEVAILLQEMGMTDVMQIRAEVLKLWSRRACANKDMFDKDL